MGKPGSLGVALLALLTLGACGRSAPPSASVWAAPPRDAGRAQAAAATSEPTSAPATERAASPGSGTPSPAAVFPLVTVVSRGGLCPDGAGGRACARTTTIARNGQARTERQPGGAIVEAELPAAAVARLADEITRADFARLRARPFTGTCPTAYDGTEVIVTFHTPHGPERIASCETAIDTGLSPFDTLWQLLSLLPD